MKRATFFRYFAALAVVCMLCMVRTIRAQGLPLLDMVVVPAAQTAAPADMPMWSVQLTNNTPDTAYFILTGFDAGFPVTPDITVPAYNSALFGTNETLSSGASLTLTNLFQTQVSVPAADAVYIATAATLYDLYDDSTFSNLLVNGVTASSDYQLTVQNPQAVPEPSSVALLFGAGMTCLGYIVRRKRDAASPEMRCSLTDLFNQ